MYSLQTSTGTTLMHLVEEKMGATELRKKYDLLPLFFGRLAGGAEQLLEDDILKERWQKNSGSGLKRNLKEVTQPRKLLEFL